jgi:hypothetical protein
MYNILLLALSYCLPPLNNVYKGSISFPLLGTQNIEFERLQKNTSQVKLRGLINCKGYIYNDENDENISMNYDLDNNLINIIRKYRCSIEAPYYDIRSDTILFVLKINVLGLTKTIKLLNVE